MKLYLTFSALLALMAFGVTVKSKKAFFHRQPANQTVQAGTRKVLIQCFVKNYQGKIQWAKDHFAFNISPKRPRFSIVPSNSPGEQNLQIVDVTVDDDGIYDCQAVGEKLLSYPAYLNVTVPPRNVSISRVVKGAIIMKRNEGIRLNCTAFYSKPASTIFWRVAGERRQATSEELDQPRDSKLVSTTSDLDLSSQSVKNGSKVECVASHAATNTRVIARATVNIIYPPGPPHITENMDHPFIAGQSVTLTCVSEGGNPLATLAWFLDNVLIEGNFHHHGNTSTNVLRHSFSAKDHKKRLECASSNAATRLPISTGNLLNVLYPPETVDLTQNPESVVENGSVTLTCLTSESNPQASLKWFQDGKRFLADSGIIIPPIPGDLSQSSLTVKDVTREYAASVYSCTASIPELNFAKTVRKNLNVLYPPTSVVVNLLRMPSNIVHEPTRSLKAGEKIQLKCAAKGGNPSPTLSWFHGGSLAADQDGVTVLPGAEVSGCVVGETCAVLEISLTPRHNEALFTCEATHKTLEYSKSGSITLKVFFPPASLTIHLQPSQPISGREVTLTCTTSSSNPGSEIKWLRNGKPFLNHQSQTTSMNRGSNGGFISTSRIRWIPNHDDNGHDVICRAENRYLERGFVDKTITLNIEYPPYFEDGPRLFNATKGQRNFVLHIPVHANPRNVTYRWWRLLEVKGQRPRVPSSSSIGEKHKNTKSWNKSLVPNNSRMSWSRLDGQLQFRQVQQIDEGLYLVEATNSLGVATIQITLHALFSPAIERLEGPGVVNESSDVTLTCVAKSHSLSPVRIRWKKKVRNPHRNLDNVATSNGTSVLKLINVTSHDRGMYSCVASNGIKPDAEEEVALMIRFSARIDSIRTLDKVAKPDQSQWPGTSTLPCYASGNPRPTFHWRNENGSVSNGDSMESGIATVDDDVYVSNLKVEVGGLYDDVIRYTCVVANSIGMDEKNVFLTPRGIPDPPKDVALGNITHNSISLAWIPGFDGGVTQTFILRYQLRDESTNSDERWIEKSIPVNRHDYIIKGLQSRRTYKIKMYSINSFGRSNETGGLTITTGSSRLSATSTSESPGFNYYVVVVVACAVVVLFVVVFTTFYCRRKRSLRLKSLNTETMSLPTAVSSVIGSDSPNEKTDEIKFDQLSRVSFTPADPFSGRSEYVDLRRPRRSEVSPSPDSTYSSLNPEERQRDENGCSENIGVSAYPNQRLSLAEDRRDDLTVPRRVRSISGVDCKSPVPTLSYVEFMRKATSTKDPAENKWENPRDLCADETKSECDARLRFGNESVRYCNDKTTASIGEQRGFHTMGRTSGRLMVALPPFKPLEEEVQHYQPQEERFGGLKNQLQLSDAAYASCDTSISSVGFQSNQNQSPANPFSSSHIPNPYAVSVSHAASATSSYPQNNLYVLNANNGYEFKTDPDETTPLSFAGDSNHFVPLRSLSPTQCNGGVAPAHIPRPTDLQLNNFTRQNSSVSQASSASDGYPKLFTDGYQQQMETKRRMEPGYRASFASAQPLLSQHNNPPRSSTLGASSMAYRGEDENSERKSLLQAANPSHDPNASSSSGRNVAFLGVDKSGTLFI